MRPDHSTMLLPDSGSRVGQALPITAVLLGIVLVVPATLLAGSRSGLILVAGIAALAIGLCALISPVLAATLVLVTMFLRLPIRSAIELPVELFFVAFAGLAVTTVLWLDRTPVRLRGIGAIECAMAFYILWNVYSMLTPHEYPAGNPLSFATYSVPRSIVIAAVIPFGMYVVGRYVFGRTSAVRGLLWAVMAMAAYAAAVSIMPFIGLSHLVWPRYIVEISRPEQGARSELEWLGRALGIFNQPVANGMVLGLCFAIAMLLASRREEPNWRRFIAVVIGIACGVGVYMTHTRAAWLSAAVVLIIGVLLARGFRRGFVSALLLVVTVVITNWSAFTSDDRSQGGVASSAEISARLNVNRTALWAAAREPIEGWGIGRFQHVNFHHHQQWSQDVPWIDGYGLVAHENELGILAELGVIGLAAWLSVLVLIAHRLWGAYRTLPQHDLCGKPIAVIAIMAMASLVCTGLTVDLRYFDFPVAFVFLLAGIAVGWSDRRRRSDVRHNPEHPTRVTSLYDPRRTDAAGRGTSR